MFNNEAWKNLVDLFEMLYKPKSAYPLENYMSAGEWLSYEKYLSVMLSRFLSFLDLDTLTEEDMYKDMLHIPSVPAVDYDFYLYGAPADGHSYGLLASGDYIMRKELLTDEGIAYLTPHFFSQGSFSYDYLLADIIGVYRTGKVDEISEIDAVWEARTDEEILKDFGIYQFFDKKDLQSAHMSRFFSNFRDLFYESDDYRAIYFLVKSDAIPQLLRCIRENDTVPGRTKRLVFEAIDVLKRNSIRSVFSEKLECSYFMINISVDYSSYNEGNGCASIHPLAFLAPFILDGCAVEFTQNLQSSQEGENNGCNKAFQANK